VLIGIAVIVGIFFIYAITNDPIPSATNTGNAWDTLKEKIYNIHVFLKTTEHLIMTDD
jgi:hypothetical protein